MRINEKSAVNNAFSHALCKSALTERLDRNNLTALVKTARGTHPVREVRRGALRAGAELREREHGVIRPAHALAATRRFTFGNTHM